MDPTNRMNGENLPWASSSDRDEPSAQMDIRQQRKLSLDRWPNNNENSINKPFIERTVRETPTSERAVGFRVIY